MLRQKVHHASEYQYRRKIVRGSGSELIVVSQSGETHDVIESMRCHKKYYGRVLGITNNNSSTIQRESSNDCGLCISPEISVAATKTFTMSCLRLLELACSSDRKHKRSFAELLAGGEVEELFTKTLALEHDIIQKAKMYSHCKNFLFLGRQYNYAIAREAALKLKEVSYIHAEGMPAAEMKHGPLALVDENTPSLFILTDQGLSLGPILTNIREVASRGGPVIVVTDEYCKNDILRLDFHVDIIVIPSFENMDSPIKNAIHSLLANYVLQLFAYHMAKELGVNPDRPRNLSKTVTV